MTLTLASDAPFSVDFTGVTGMQCMGSTAYTPGAYPNGIPGSMEIVDGWFKATIRQTDPPTATGVRSEITLPNQALGDEAWFTWEMLIKSDEWTEQTGQIIIGQCHPKEGINASGYFDFYVRDGWLTFAIPNTEPPTEGSYVKKHYWIHPIKLNHVYKMAIHTKWVASVGNGYLEAFVDGEQVFKNWFLGTGYATDTPYFKLGLYDGPHAANFGTKAARFRNLKRYHGVGGYEEVLGVVPLPPKRLVGSI